ncbi:MAG: tetratricopeptide repeat-containing protein kinase family protein, partial [Planctomycetota bacterium]
LGVILFQIICNHRVFESRQRNVLLRQTREGDLSHAMECLESTDASPDLVKLCKECLKSDPDERISDAGVIAMGVSEFLSGFERRLRQAEVDRASAIVRSEESRKRQNWTIGLGALVAVIGLLTLALIADQLRRTKKLAQTERAARTKAEVETQTTGEVNEFLEFILTSGLPKYRGSDVTMLEVIDDFVPELDGKLNERPAVEARIRRTVGESYRWLGELDASEEQLRKAIDAFERANMGKTIEALFTRDRLAGTLRSRDDAGDIKEAIAIRREVVENLRSIIGPDHSETLNVMNNLGITMVLDERASDDQLDEAESIYNEVLERIGQSPELQKELRAGVLVNVASLAVKRANWAKAERIFKEVIEDQGENTYAVLNAGVQLGMMLVERNRPSEAADVLYDAYLGRAKYHGELNHLTLSVFRKFTRALVAAKRFEEAIEATEKSERLHTEDHWFACGNVFEARKLKTESLLGLNRTEDATVFLRETISRYAEHRGEDHAYTREAREQLRRLESEDD